MKFSLVLLAWVYIQTVSAQLRQVAYLSTTTSMDGFNEGIIRDILLTCRKYNSEHHITGILLYHKTQIFQIVEGSSEAIQHVLERIERDTRHRGIIFLYDKMVDQRSFGRWAMMFRDLEYTDKIQEWIQDETEIEIFNQIVSPTRANTPITLAFANTKVLKLLEIYKTLLFDH